ncbi:hypothetical protein C1N74_16005 (plasmid) [Microbacterium sp. SGAir0570]|uniref:hypothetical protein n=1 Tax=Microbacterium sp. SGAir0570 TaxID=2070348 RepID=UPI0010CCC47F|nr:hypothetical protein [Microbacterium sp. SGAir0570]QCR42096.1 hypothetical protein C1N74_16005 [Microbacterium sp. SGAir0570]
MAYNTPAEAFGEYASMARELIIEVVQTRHDSSADGHDAAKTRFLNFFGSQWRDLLCDARDAFKERGFETYKLSPGGYRVPIVNDALLFVTRVPEGVDVVRDFASSKTRVSSFFARRDPELFGNSFIDGGEEARNADEVERFEKMVEAAGAVMPVVLVMVHSTPRQLSSIDWAVAEYRSGQVHLHGEESIWSDDYAGEGIDFDVESFDSGVPAAPVVGLARDLTSDE